MDVSIIVVNYNTAHIIGDCITAALKQKNVNYEIIVVDNASKDNSLAVLANFQDQITCIANPNNSGFGPANNLAFKQCQGRYIFLLNPDAVLQTENDLATLVAYMDQHKKCGVVGPQVIKNQRCTPPQTVYPGQKYAKNTFANLPGTIAWIIGACMLIRAAAFQAIGGFDEDYFLYAEETDLCLRLRKAGWEIGYLSNIVVNHIGGASEKNTATAELWRKKQNGILLFYKKNYPTAAATKIVKKNRLRAQFRVWLLQLKKVLGRHNATDAAKLIRYQVVAQSAQEFLRKI